MCRLLHSEAQEVRRRCAGGRNPAAPAQGAAAFGRMAAAVTEAQQLRAQSLRALVLVNLGSDAAVGLRWRPRTMVPTVDNLDALRPLFLRANSLTAYIEQVLFANECLAALEECQSLSTVFPEDN